MASDQGRNVRLGSDASVARISDVSQDDARPEAPGTTPDVTPDVTPKTTPESTPELDTRAAEAAAADHPASILKEKKELVEIFAATLLSDSKADLDTQKISIPHSSLEPRRETTAPEIAHEPAGLEHVSNIEILAASNKPPKWLTRRRLYILGGAALLFVLAAILAIGLVVGLALRRSDAAPTTPAPPASTPAAACGTQPSTLHRQLLSASSIASHTFLFARGTDGGVHILENLRTWLPLGATSVFSGPPTAIAWRPWGQPRVSVFAPSANAQASVLTATWGNGSWDANWENLGESAGSAVALCRLPEGYISSAAGSPERIDQWVVNRDSRGVFHDFWQYLVDDFQEPATYTEWEGSMANQASAGGAAVVCRGTDPMHTLVVYANGTDSVRFRHYMGGLRTWNPWIDLGGEFVGDPVLLEVGESNFNFFGVGVDGGLHTFNWTNATGPGYRPAVVALGGNFSSVPSAVVTSKDPMRLDVVGRGVDGFVKHLAYRNQKWGEWEDLGVETGSAPFLFSYEDADAGNSSRTLLAARLGVEEFGGELESGGRKFDFGIHVQLMASTRGLYDQGTG
ncbi:hypothetical protein B0H67DRAFT_647505 [Lasiosphaeris hirsuta]|uniref:PLL-like beta propeller domain-containing protein n=1 Tax=Lasiosphaeris hirsuta TaxID=260670 RepID=A0AA40A172_9PEZI|nr:hypothetical protein B0H67DRAFT_647505 [Lasiosphaeris hirsuta]